MENKHKGAAVIYVRVSTEDQVNGLSLDVQEKVCRKKASDEGYDVLEVLKDGGISGHDENRPGIKRIKELVEAEEIQAIVALSSDRLFRNTRAHMEAMELFLRRGIRVLYINQASPEDNATSIMTDSVVATMNQFYRDQISDKVKGVLYARVEAGYFPSTAPPGYMNVGNPDLSAPRIAQKIVVLDPVTAPLIREVFQRYATGVYSVYDLTDMLSERGVRSHRGFSLSPSRVYELLRNRFYLGEVKWGKAFCKEGKHEPLVDESTFNKVQSILETHNNKACRRRKYSWLLSGFIYCAKHDKRYVAEWH